MKIVHICLCGPVTDGYNYQDNLLTKYHKRMGLDVTIIASQWVYGDKGQLEKAESNDYINENGIHVMRLSIPNGTVNSKFKVYPRLINALSTEKPDIIFIHDPQFLDICRISKYLKKHSKIQVYIDNHVDYSNGARGWLSYHILHKIIWKRCLKSISPYVTRYYGVLPARVDFLNEMYDIPVEKCKLLVMGADDDEVKRVRNPKIRQNIRSIFDIKNEDFVIMTGGKINRFRPETLNLIRAVKEINNHKIKLVVFGSVDEEYRKEFNQLCKDNNIIYVGWLKSSKTYDYMVSADLIVFPGLHSVMWEQAVALGIPCVFRNIEGFHHVDLGGNARFIDDISEEGLKKIILDIIEDDVAYKRMKYISQEKGIKEFSYQKIANESICDVLK